MKITRKIFLLLFPLHTFFILSALSLTTKSYDICISINNSYGSCVPFEFCPSLFGILKSSQITSSQIILLQRLTCSIENYIPKICCPLKDINLDALNYFNSKSSSSSSSSIGDIMYPSSIEIETTSKANKIEPLSNNKKIQSGKVQSEKSTSSTTSTVKTTTTTTKLPGLSNSQEIVSEEEFPDYYEQLLARESEEFVSKNEKVQNGDKKDSITRNNAKHKNFNLFPILAECSNPQSSDRIIGGDIVKHASLPWMALIGYRNKENDELEYFCGATVINNRYLITAAHCTEEIDEELEPEVIRLGEFDKSKEDDCSELGCSKAVDYPIEEIIPHPKYSKETKVNDIGLIRIDRNLTFDTPFIKQICLPFLEEYNIQKFFPKVIAGLNGFVAGWGRTKWNKSNGSNRLREVSLPIITNEQCQKNYSTRASISDTQFCAGGIKNKDACGGDSGGPFLLPVRYSKYSEPKFFQTGIVSYGPIQCGASNLPGVYTNVSMYLKWILDTIKP